MTAFSNIYLVFILYNEGFSESHTIYNLTVEMIN